MGVWLFGSAPVLAQDTDEAARRHFRLGRAHYDNGSFQEAAREFEEAYRLSNRPQLLYNVFVAHRDAGNLAPATEALRRYLELVPDAEDRDQLQARLASMERLLATQSGSGAVTPSSTGTDPGTDTAPDTGTDPRPDSDPTPESGTDTPDGETGGPDRAAPRVDPDGARRPSIVPWIVVASGGAFLVGAGITGLVTAGIESDLEDQCGADLRCPAELRDDAETGETLAVVTDVLLATAIVTAGIGIGLMFLLGGDDEDAEPAAEPAAACGPTGCAASLRVRF